MSPGNAFILRSKGQGHEAQKTMPSCGFALLWVLAISCCCCRIAGRWAVTRRGR